MKKFYSKFLASIILTLFSIHVHANNYSVNVGEQTNLYCTASAPANGWITHAFYELTDPNDAQYIAISYTSSELKATVLGISAKSSIKIAVTYHYSYRGTYDDKIHVGHATYYDYVTVKGGGTATNIQIIPSNPQIKVGETIQLKVQLTPSNSSTSWTWGVISSVSSRPSTYETSIDGNIITFTGKKKGTVYLAAQTSNGLTATCVVKTVEADSEGTIEPTSVNIDKDKQELTQGEKRSLSYTIIPNNASTTISWSSSDENIATISSNGVVTAVNPGNVRISINTSNGLSDFVDIVIHSTATDISLPQEVIVNLGYSYSLVPSFTPSDSQPVCSWSSDDTSIATVTAGKITGKKEGNVTIKVSTNNDLTSSTQAKVVIPSEAMNYRNTAIKLSKIKDLVYKSISSKK